MEAMRLLKVLLISFLIVFGAVVGIGYLLPSDWEVERSVIIKAPREKIYPYLTSFKYGWPQWSSFDFEDPDIKFSYAGPDDGVGAERYWISEHGNGSQKITKANPDEGIEFEIRMDNSDFVLYGEIRFDPTTDGTKVTWRDWGHIGKNPFYRYMAFSMDKIMGETFEKSLANLKAKVEASTLSIQLPVDPSGTANN